MSKLKVLLPGGKSLTLSSSFAKVSGKLSLLVSGVNILSALLFSLFVFLIPISGSLFSLDFETSVLRFLVIVVFLLLLVFVFKLIFQGSSFVVDPKGLLMILVFNLVLTLSTLSIAVVKVSGTFGAMGFRYLAGITLMSLIGVFYFINLYSTNLKQVRTTLKLFSAGVFTYIFINLLTNNSNSAQIINNIPLIIAGFASFSVIALSTKNKVVGSFLLLTFFLFALILIPFNATVYYPLFLLSICLLIAYSLSLILFWSKTKKSFAFRFKTIKNNISNFIHVRRIPVPTIKGLADLHFVLIYVAPLVILLASIFFFFNLAPNTRTSVISNISFPYTESVKLLTGGTYSVTSQNLRSILLGVGSDNYSAAWPFLANVITVTGLLGSAIYLFLWIYFIKVAKENFLKAIKERSEYKFSGLLLFLSLFIPLVLTINYGGILTLVLLWFIYGLSSSIQTIKNEDYLSGKYINKGSLLTNVVRTAILLAIGYALLNVLNLALSLIK